jgi:hypothetical protein
MLYDMIRHPNPCDRPIPLRKSRSNLLTTYGFLSAEDDRNFGLVPRRDFRPSRSDRLHVEEVVKQARHRLVRSVSSRSCATSSALAR